MNPISQEIFENYQARRTQKQKTAFINNYVQKLSDEGIEAHVEKGGWLNHRNIHIGNLEKAQFVFTAHYDTAPKTIFPFPKVLVLPNKAFLSEMINFLASIIFITMLTIPFLFLGVAFKTILMFYPVLFLAVVLSGFLGPTNHQTANDNTSGVIGINEMIFTLQDDLDHVAFVLFDNEEKGLLGSASFARAHKEILQDKIVVNLDCLSNGDHLMILSSKELMKNAEFNNFLVASFGEVPEGKNRIIEELTYFPSDQMNFKNSVAIVACQKMPVFGRYLTDIHTSKDVVFDQENIAYIKDSLVSLVRATGGIKLIGPPKKLNFIQRFWANTKPGEFVMHVLLIGMIGFLIGIFLG